MNEKKKPHLTVVKREPSPKERATKRKLRLQSEFSKESKKLIPGTEAMDKKKWAFSMWERTIGPGMKLVSLLFRRKGG